MSQGLEGFSANRVWLVSHFYISYYYITTKRELSQWVGLFTNNYQ